MLKLSILKKILSFNRRTSSTILFCALWIIARFYLKSQRRLLQFKLSNPIPYFDGYEISKDIKLKLGDVALVLQGPINKYHEKIATDFAKRVKAELGFGYVLYSGPDADVMKNFCDVSVKPINRSECVNQYTLQRASTLTGLQSAQKLGAKYALKLRADSILTRRDALLTLIERYESASQVQLVVVSHQKPYYYPFLSDHLIFGSVDDLIRLWEFDWNGELDITHNGFSDNKSKSPEWVLGNSFVENFPGGKIAIVSDCEVGYLFLKYDYYDPNRFDYESVPHFGLTSVYPANESCIGGVEDRIVKHFGMYAYENKFSMPLTSDEIA